MDKVDVLVSTVIVLLLEHTVKWMIRNEMKRFLQQNRDQRQSANFYADFVFSVIKILAEIVND